MSAKMSPNELKSIFEKYAAKEGDPNQLSKEELRLLIQTEFPSLLKVSAQLQSPLNGPLNAGGEGREGRGERKRARKRLRSEILIRVPPGVEHTAAKTGITEGEHLTCAFLRWWQTTFHMARS